MAFRLNVVLSSSLSENNKMKKSLCLIASLVAVLASQAAVADESPWLVRLRAVYLDPANKSDPIGGVGASDRLSVNSRVIPEFDISYFFTPNWATELVLTYPQKQDVSLDGTKIGSFKHLPPTLTLQYHFAPQSTFSPYVGAGINYTRFSNVSLLNGGATMESHSIGGALQAGVDIKIDSHWSLNLDVKKVQIRSDIIAASGAKLSNAQVDPWLLGVGVGYRF
jgi:outer membrane protein